VPTLSSTVASGVQSSGNTLFANNVSNVSAGVTSDGHGPRQLQRRHHHARSIRRSARRVPIPSANISSPSFTNRASRRRSRCRTAIRSPLAASSRRPSTNRPAESRSCSGFRYWVRPSGQIEKHQPRRTDRLLHAARDLRHFVARGSHRRFEKRVDAHEEGVEGRAVARGEQSSPLEFAHNACLSGAGSQPGSQPARASQAGERSSPFGRPSTPPSPQSR
jgi:hypothetical protein